MSSAGVSKRTRSWAIATVLAACRSGHLELQLAEDRLDRIYAATTDAEVYGAIAGLPHPPAPLVLGEE